MTFSVIIPTLDEQDLLAETLTRTATLGFDELIVVDGGSTDRTVDIATRLGREVRVLTSAPGRARQMNTGARAARGDVLLFLHADTRLPDNARAAVRTALDETHCVGGRFDIQFNTLSGWARVISFMMNLRSRATGIATGDQAIFVRRRLFEQLGGFPDQPLMEDVAFTTRLKRAGKTVALRARATSSFRRWERRGPLRTILLMWALRFLYWIGVSPVRLARWYGTVR